ncbi:hypothetical protein [Nitriliruptor alkaliphilus]|uniref:hypothetical protein n=1 Tax=Nitriliruptor alkaliphilus TaxID=427918 RepID=UPI0012EEAA1D|nr:hypothetical protein [Nitriliruptor alkaliphilus]
MTARSRAWLVLAGMSAALLVAAGVTGLVVRDPIDGWPLVLVSWSVVGALVVARRPVSLVGRLLVLFATGFAMAIALEYYLLVSLEAARPPADPFLWLSAWLFAPVLLVLMYLIAVFPADRVASAWMRWPLAAAAVVTGMGVVARMVLPVPVATETSAELVNPWAIEALSHLLAVEGLLGSVMTTLLVVAMVDLALRWRRSTGIERLQMRWLALALLLFALLLLATGVVRLAGLSPTGIEVADTVAWLSGLGLLPLAVGVAVTRYRLFEIDRFISRTVTYAAVAAALAAVYVAGVLVLGNLLPRQSDLGVAASTLAVAALFLPLRRRVQQAVERRFNRSRYDAERELERFAARLRDELDLDLDSLTDDLLDVVATTVQPARASVWMR